MSYILQGRALPAVVAPPVASITIQDLDAALTQLVALAPPEFPYSKFDHVEKRFQRTSRPHNDVRNGEESDGQSDGKYSLSLFIITIFFVLGSLSNRLSVASLGQ